MFIGCLKGVRIVGKRGCKIGCGLGVKEGDEKWWKEG